MTLRPYQQEAVDAVMRHVMASTTPCILEAATGAGKSHIIAEISKLIHQRSGKRILNLAPSGILVEQNYKKYLATGNYASMFSASVGQKSTRFPVVFGTPGTVKNRISRFQNDLAAIIIDEAHGLTPTVLSIVDAIRGSNPNLRVIGLSATPYRMNEGFIYAIGPDNRAVDKEQRLDHTFFKKCVYQIRARTLIDMGYLTQPIIGSIGAEHYQTLGMTLNNAGNFSQDDIDRAYHGHGRKTAAIVMDVVEKSRDRRGVIIFAATVAHAHEVLASLPPSISRIMTSQDADQKQCKAIVDAFKRQDVKYLVNVGKLTTGFDAPHVDVVALLRATESVGLLQQIIGRGLRLFDGKDDCLILDYAENLERHCPDGDIFAPIIKAKRQKEGGGKIDCICLECGGHNTFTVRPNESGYEIDPYGYFTDLDGTRIPSEYGDVPAHYGRRCTAYTMVRGDFVQCNYWWTFKKCPHCEHKNDIAARYCAECKGEIVDPNEKLRIEYKALKSDPTRMQCDRVLDWTVTEGVSKAGNATYRIDIVTPHRHFPIWVIKDPGDIYKAEKKLGMVKPYLFGDKPETVTYRKETTNQFYNIYALNQPIDAEPEG